MDVGFVILKLEDDEAEYYDHLEFTRERESFKRITFEEGTYALVPLTSGALMQKTMQASGTEIPPKITFNDTQWPHPYFSSTINDIFRKLDLAVNGLLSAEELNQFGRIVKEPVFMGIKQEEFATPIFEKVSCNKEGVSLLGFKQLLFRNFNDAQIQEIFAQLGYDKALNSLKSRAFMLSFQAENEITVDINDILDSDFYKTAWAHLLNHIKDEEGLTEQSTEEDDYTLFAYPHDNAYTSSYLFDNTSDSHLKVSLDLSDSESCLFIPNDGTIEKIVAPGDSVYLGSLAWDPDALGYSYTYNIDYQEVDVDEEEEYESEESGGDDEEEDDEENEDNNSDSSGEDGDDSY